MAKAQEGWLVAALDAISQFRATKEPLKNVVKRLIVQRRLGSRDRAKMSDAVFAWSRLQSAGDQDMADQLKAQGISRPSLRQIDQAILEKWQASGDSEQRFPDWFTAKLSNAYGVSTAALLESLQTRAGPSLAVDTRHASVAEVGRSLLELGVPYKHWSHFDEAICIDAERFQLETLPAAIRKHVWLMDPASQLVAHIATPEAGKKVLDCCAGGGGKTQFMLSRGAQVVAMDISERRLDSVKKRCLGERVRFLLGDAREPPFEPESFHAVLLDSPCSGTGTIRRAPDLLLRLNEEQLADFVKLQQELIRSMVRLLKEGGTLTYATCSILPEENHEQSVWALKNFPLKLVSERQLLPSHDDSDGFYVAVMQKVGE